MSALPALADALAIRDDDPQALAGLTRHLEGSGAFDRVFSPSPHWVCATRALAASRATAQAAPGCVFLEGGDEAAAQAPGDVSTLRFEPGGDVLISRAIAGAMPVYAWSSGKRCAVATRLAWLPAFAGTPATPDLLVYAMWAYGMTVFPDNRAPLRNVSVVPCGASVRIRSGVPHKPEPWWTAPATPARLPTSADIDESARLVRSAVLDYLDRNLSRDSTNLCSLSGGADSSTVTALAARTFGAPVATWSLVPGWEPDRARELGYIDSLTQWAGIRECHRWDITADSIVALVRAHGPSLFPVMLHYLLALPELHAHAPVGTMLGGEFADEAFGSVRTPPDMSMSSSAADIVRLSLRGHPGMLPRFVKHRLLWLARRPVTPFMPELHPAVNADLRAEYREWVRRQRRELAAGDPANSYLRASLPIFQGLAAMGWEACAPLGVRRLTPFFHRRIVELAFQTHPWARLHDGPKTLLRRAFAGEVPERNLQRRDKGPFSHVPWPASLPFQPIPLVREVIDFEGPESHGFDRIAAALLNFWLTKAS